MYACEGLYGACYTPMAQELSRSRLKGSRKMVTVIATVFEAADLTVPEKKTETMLLRTPDQTALAPPITVEAADQMYKRTAQLLYLGGIIHKKR